MISGMKLRKAQEGIASVLGTADPASPRYDIWHDCNRGLSPQERKRLMVAASLIRLTAEGLDMTYAQLLAYLDKELVIWGDLP